jgi:hypothetical protein
LSCLIRAPCWVGAPRWGGRQRRWPAAPPSTTPSPLGPACGAGRHPSSPVLLSGPSVGQRGISAQSIQLLVPVTPNYIGTLPHTSLLSPVHCQLLLCHSGTCSSLNSGLTRRTFLRSTAASATTASYCSRVKLQLTVVALPVVVYSTAAAAAGSALRGGWRPVWFVDARGCFAGATACAAVGIGAGAAWVVVLPVAAAVAVVVAAVLATARPVSARCICALLHLYIPASCCSVLKA